MLPVSGELEANLVFGLAKTFKVHFLFETHLISFDLIQCTFLKKIPITWKLMFVNLTWHLFLAKTILGRSTLTPSILTPFRDESILKNCPGYEKIEFILHIHSIFIYYLCSFKIIISSFSSDDCSSVTCQNGGTCVDGINTATCDCVPGFTGSSCETNIGKSNWFSLCWSQIF